MITKTKFFALSAVILIVFVMFQFIGNSVDIFFTFDTNESAAYTPSRTKPEGVGYGSYMCFANPDGVAAIVTKGTGDIPGVTDACDYLKIKYEYSRSLSELDASQPRKYSLLVIGDCDIELQTDIDILKTFLANEVNVIFAVLPPLSLLKNEVASEQGITQAEKNRIDETNSLRRELRRIIGTQTIYADEQTVSGLTFFDGFLLGGGETYEECEPMTVPHFGLFASGKAYVMGILDDFLAGEEYRNERLPHIVWRNTYTGSFVFTVNAHFMRYSSGIGFFTAILSEMCDVFAYPVINAQTMLLNGVPTLSAENVQLLSRYYNQTIEYFFQTSVLPSVSSVLYQTGFVPTYFALSRFSCENSVTAEDSEYYTLMQFYLKQSLRQGGEIGLSGYGGGERVMKDIELFTRILPSYAFTVFSTGDMSREEYTALLSACEQLSGVTTVVCGLRENGDIEKFEYLDDSTLIFPQTDNGYVHTAGDDIALRSIMTALGCSNTGIDGYDIVYPAAEEDWTSLATNWARFTHTDWQPFKKFDKLTVTQADSRVRDYLAQTYKITQDGDVTYIDAESFGGEGYLILRAENKRIVSRTGCTYEKLEDGSYLLKLTEPHAQVVTAQTESISFK